MKKSKSIKTKPVKFRSKFEKAVAEKLTKLKVRWDYETVSFPYTLPERTYTPDFILSPTVVYEAKGILDRDTRLKMLAVKSQHPYLRIIFILQAPKNKLAKGAKMRNWEWCEKHGFEWQSLETLSV